MEREASEFGGDEDDNIIQATMEENEPQMNNEMAIDGREVESASNNGIGIEDDEFGSISQIDGSAIHVQGNWIEIVKHDPREIYQIVKAMAFREVYFKL